MKRALALAFAMLLIHCGGDAGPDAASAPVACPGQGDYPYADVISDAPGHVKTPAAIDVPENATNGVVQGDATSGSLDVYSRGLSADPPNNTLTLRWSGRRVVDVDGPDFVVFENAFETAGGVFMDPTVVEVSADGEHWVTFPHDYVADDEQKATRAPDDWQGFAGVTPVLWRSESCTDPMAVEAGGDRFDLADLSDETVKHGFTFLRLTAAATVENPDTGEPFPRDFLSDGFDIDGVFAAETVAE